MDKVKYFLKRAKEASDLETKLVLLTNAYNCLKGLDDSLKPAYSVVFMSKDEYQAIINACINDSDTDSKCSPANYDLASLCNKLEQEIILQLQKF